MKIVAIMPVRNEDWVLGLSARALLKWVDELVILDHCSTDGTDDIIYDLSKNYGRIVRVFEHDPKWEEMRHRQRLLDVARTCGATHIVTIDADEVLSGNLLPYARDIVGNTPPGMVLQLPWITCRDSIYQHHRSGLWAEQHASMAFVDDPKLHWQQRNGYDFHNRAPMGRPEVPFKPISHLQGGILHLQYSNRRRLLAKQALYKLTEIIRWPGRDSIDVINARYNWSVYGQAQKPDWMSPLSFDLQVTPENWWEGYEDLMQHLHLDAAPWQEAECRKLIEQHGRAKFAGLDLFGVV
jgi:glycosyltransferase involved in cell wall biosynthesis